MKKLKFPKPGLRIIKSITAVCICFIIYVLRGKTGMPFYSAIAALQCMQPYKENMKQMARKRVMGTMVGAFFGLIVLLIELYALPPDLIEGVVPYFIASLFAGVVLYATVVMDITAASYFSCVVFLSITVNHVRDLAPYIYVLNRVVDTWIGVVVAIAINSIPSPGKRNTHSLFLAELGDTLESGRIVIPSRMQVELNRMLEAGLKFTVSTTQTPAIVREMLSGIRLRYPIIAMDGAVLYNPHTNEYLEVCRMGRPYAERIESFLQKHMFSYFAFCVKDDLLLIQFPSLANQPMEGRFMKNKDSFYRNYVQSRHPDYENVVYFLIFDQIEQIEALRDEFKRQEWIGGYLIRTGNLRDYPGFSWIRICSCDVSQALMAGKLKDWMEFSEIVTMGEDPGCDIEVNRTDYEQLVAELKKRF